jgi:outer membrane protein assembly factor BamA
MKRIFLSAIFICCSIQTVWALDSSLPPKTQWESFPIAMYDSDTGFGLGAKSVLLNQLGYQESADLTLFASTLGERWARLVVSHPDFSLRQGTLYPLSLDAKVEYDRMIQNHFFGVGNRTESSSKETFNKEPLTLEMTGGHGFSKSFSITAGGRYRCIVNSKAKADGLLESMGSPSVGRVAYGSAFLGVQYDTRNSYLRPSKGWMLEGEVEKAPGHVGEDKNYTRWDTTFRRYIPLDCLRSVLAFRLRLQGLDHRDLPVQTLLSLGGGSSLRGYPQDRFLDTALALTNAECRFPIYKRLGGIAGCDAGKVWDSFGEADLKRWAVNSVAGLRLYMETFTVRVDYGLSREGSGLYFNFDQVI